MAATTNLGNQQLTYPDQEAHHLQPTREPILRTHLRLTIHTDIIAWEATEVLVVWDHLFLIHHLGRTFRQLATTEECNLPTNNAMGAGAVFHLPCLQLIFNLGVVGVLQSMEWLENTAWGIIHCHMLL